MGKASWKRWPLCGVCKDNELTWQIFGGRAFQKAGHQMVLFDFEMYVILYLAPNVDVGTLDLKDISEEY